MGYFRRKLRRGVCLAEKRSACAELPIELREWVAASVEPPPSKPCRYVRLAVARLNNESYQFSGAFAATYQLLDSGRLSAFDIERFYRVLEWFHDNLRIPRTLNTSRGIFWFKSSATDCIDTIWDLARLLRIHGEDVRMMVTTDPGSIVYEDEHQIAAVSRRRL